MLAKAKPGEERHGQVGTRKRPSDSFIAVCRGETSLSRRRRLKGKRKKKSQCNTGPLWTASTGKYLEMQVASGWVGHLPEKRPNAIKQYLQHRMPGTPCIAQTCIVSKSLPHRLVQLLIDGGPPHTYMRSHSAHDGTAFEWLCTHTAKSCLTRACCRQTGWGRWVSVSIPTTSKQVEDTRSKEYYL